ncbi:hypothetical protein BDZ94DRAFT_1216685 [Collybia nuda]|uniref:Uncharacterized protein n=1 Tax=Collybia nuda TaxID=64659 RepID=A0A9P5Y8I2_9AGAR|nr:hypothetical protein BDZ94DRAFT_1216685 [Collybia nuda]
MRIPDNSHQPPPWPFSNMSKYLLMNWLHTGGTQKSESEVTRLARDVISAPSFKPEDLAEFDTNRENKQIDTAQATTTNTAPFSDDDWREVSVVIDIPVPIKGSSPQKFQVPGLHHRSIIQVIKATFGDSTARSFHLTPFKRIHVDPTGQETRIFDEVYTSEAFEEAHDKLQKQPTQPGCMLERVIAGLMFWSDSTHLTNFGTASVWPIYMYYANLSKYIRAKPNSGACHHIAYIPSLPDNLSDFISTFITATSHRPKILTLCKHELIHGVWRLILDDEFVEAYQHGIVMECADGIVRRVFPRVFTYSADYPEKVIIATVRNRGICPCPRCCIPMKDCDKIGWISDIKGRLGRGRTYMADLVSNGRDRIYRLGHGISSKGVEGVLKPFSLLPTVNAFADRLSAFNFNPHPMLVVDLLHEFELGVWKATFIHIIRVLYAAVPGGKAVHELNARFRQVPTFGISTIRRFANNASEMKKLAARDFEDLLQNIIPVVEGLLPEPHNTQLLRLLYRLAEWHALAKLRMHTDHTLKLLDESTVTLGKEMHSFRNSSSTAWTCKELPSETASRGRRIEKKRAKLAAQSLAASVPLPPDGLLPALNTLSDNAPVSIPIANTPKVKTLNLNTYKFHALGDYVRAIRMFGTTDSYSTQIGELAHRTVKGFYRCTNKKNATKQIARHERRQTCLRRARKAAQDPQRHHVHHVGFSDNDPLPCTGVDLHHHMSNSKAHAHHLQSFIREPINDPSKLSHLLGRLLERDFEGDEDPQFLDEERNSLRIIGDRIYAVKVLRINHTTYDIRRDQDSMNPRTHCNVMLHSQETEKGAHPFWYARVLGVFHAEVLHTGENARNRSIQHMEFLWVRWFGIEPDYQSGFKVAKLPKIGFVTETDGAFGFLDPSLVLRGCHLVPAFAAGRTNQLLKTVLPTAARLPEEIDDWANYYVIIWVDRDMFMRYSGGGLGHQHESTRWTTTGCNNNSETEGMDVDLEPDLENLLENITSTTAQHNPLAKPSSYLSQNKDDEESNGSDSIHSNSSDDNDDEDPSKYGTDDDEDGRAYFGPEDDEPMFAYDSDEGL